MLPRPEPFIDPLVVNVIREQKAALLQAERATMADLTGRWLAMESRLRGAMDALAIEINLAQAQGQVVTVNYLMESGSFRALAAQTRAELLQYIYHAESVIADQQLFFGGLGLSDAAESLAQGLADYGRLPINGLPAPDPALAQVMESRVGLAKNGEALEALLRPTVNDSLQGLGSKVLEGAQQSKDPAGLVRSMQDGLARGYNRILNTSRTESLGIYRTSVRDYWKSTGLVTEYMRIATHDNRVCAGCLMDEGTRYDLESDIPEHPQGRCGMVPVIKGQARPRWLGGPRWFEQQPEGVQRDILGPGKYQAWADGKFSLDQLSVIRPNPEWGPSIGPATLKNLTS